MGNNEQNSNSKLNPIGVLAVCVACLFLTGFSASTPSDATIMSELEKLYVENCPLITINKLEKINGFPQEDGSYIARLKFTFDFVPTGEFLEMMRKYDAEMSTVIAAYKEAKGQQDEIWETASSQRHACEKTRDNDLKEPHRLSSARMKLWDERNRRRLSNSERASYQTQIDELNKKIKMLNQEIKDRYVECTKRADNLGHSGRKENKKIARNVDLITTKLRKIDNSNFNNVTDYFSSECKIPSPIVKKYIMNPNLGIADGTYLINTYFGIFNSLEGNQYRYRRRFLAKYMKEMHVSNEGEFSFVQSDTGWVIER